MDVDEDEEGTQRPKHVQDFGLEVDFDSIEEDEREVRVYGSSRDECSADNAFAMVGGSCGGYC